MPSYLHRSAQGAAAAAPLLPSQFQRSVVDQLRRGLVEEVVEVEVEVAHAQVVGTMVTFNDQEVVPVALPGVELPPRITTSMTTHLRHRQ
jgi:translation initiation factor 6 (eIF-6)